MKPQVSQTLAKISFLAACFVVYIHIPADYQQLSTSFVRWFRFGICEAAVPWFFFASGLLLAQKYGDESIYQVYSSQFVKKCKTLLVPYLIFNLIAFSMKEGGGGGWLSSFGLDIYNLPAYHLLWFVRTLFVFFVLSPPLALLVRKSRIGAFALTMLLYSLYWIWMCLKSEACESIKSLFDGIFNVRGLFYFSIGMAIRYYYIELLCAKKAIVCLLVGTGLLLCDKTSFFLLEPLYIPMILLGAFSAIANYSSANWPKFMVGNSFAIYLLHGMLLYGFRAVGYRCEILCSPCTSIAQYFIFGVVIIAICVIVIELGRRWCPLICNVALGGR